MPAVFGFLCVFGNALLLFSHASPVFSNESALHNGVLPAALSKDKEVCMKELGCFGITEDFHHNIYRPINVLPNDRETINTRFFLYTKNQPMEVHQLFAHDKESITESGLDPSHPIKFICHGFMDNELFGDWMVNMKNEFMMSKDNYNVIIVDWSGGNMPPYYQATANTRVVGAEMALLINTLVKNHGIKAEDCHIIGHSLGSHIAGYAGERIKNLGRITACDPAEPYFQNMPSNVRIDPTDADYVDVIHSDANSILFLGFGMSQLVGHADFFPNNGREQPGCGKEKIISFITDGLKEALRRISSCHHQRSLDFMHHTINYQKVVPVGIECSNWKNFLGGKCSDCGSDTSKCAIMGMRSDQYKQFGDSNVQRSFYLKTTGSSPFWLYHYVFDVKLHKPVSSHKDVKGRIEISLHGSKQDELFKLQNADSNLIHGSRYQFLVTTETELGNIKSLTLKWHSSSLNPIDLIRKPKLHAEYVSVTPLNVIEKSPRNMTGRVFCGNPENGIPPKETVSLHKDPKCMKYFL